MAKPKMTHAQAKAHLEAGRSVGVMVNGQLKRVSKLSELPSEAEIAAGDPAQEEAARANLLREQKRIEAELAILNGAAKTPVSPDPGTETQTDDDNADDENKDNGDLDDNDSSDAGNSNPPATRARNGGAPKRTTPPANETEQERLLREAAEAGNQNQ
jgi:hypothetical protein